MPLLVPEVNAGHVALLEVQRARRGWNGGIVTNPNCSATQLAMALAPLERAFGIEKVLVTTMQSVSGAGYPGVASLDVLGNIIPDIPKEAAKIETETQKLLGRYEAGAVIPAAFVVSAHTYRVPVENGHTESVSVLLSRKATAAAMIEAWRDFRGDPAVSALPSAPARPVEYVGEAHAPQPRRHSGREDGMVTWVGGLEPCAVLDWKFTVVGNNTVRGAAGGSLFNAELVLGDAGGYARVSRGRMSSVVVLKFGSSVLRSEEDLPRAVEEIARYRRLGRGVVAVVSAIGKTTDLLLEKAHRISKNPEWSALALMVATGEDVAASFLTMALEEAGVPVALMEPVGIGLRVEGPPLDATPCGLDTDQGPAGSGARRRGRRAGLLRARARRQDLPARARRLGSDGPAPGPPARGGLPAAQERGRRLRRGPRRSRIAAAAATSS